MEFMKTLKGERGGKSVKIQKGTYDVGDGHGAIKDSL